MTRHLRKNRHARKADRIEGDRSGDDVGQVRLDENVDVADVDRDSIAGGAKWSLVSLVTKQVVQIAFTIVLARLIGPSSFGIVGQALIYVAIATTVLDLGMAATLIQKPQLDRRVIGTATSAVLATAGFLVITTLALAPFWASLFDTPELTGILRVLSLSFVLNGLAVVPGALFVRRLDFKLIGIAQVSSTVIGGIAGVLAALNGAEYWALVIQILVRDAVHSLILLAVDGLPVLVASRSAAKDLTGTSRNVLGSHLLGLLNSHADDFLVGWQLGAASLANYSLSYRILQLPVQALGQTANRLVLPVFSRLHDDEPRQAKYYLSAISSLSLAVVPLMTIVALAAPLAIPAVFGHAWTPAVTPTQILALASIIWTLMTVNSPVLIANGRASWLFRYSIVNTGVLVAAAALGVRGGIVGVAWGLLLAGIPMAIVLLLVVRRVIPFTLRQYAIALVPSLTGAVAMAGFWYFARGPIEAQTSSLGTVVLVSVMSIIIYVGVLWIAWRGESRRQIEFVRAMIGRASDATELA